MPPCLARGSILPRMSSSLRRVSVWLLRLETRLSRLAFTLSKRASVLLTCWPNLWRSRLNWRPTLPCWATDLSVSKRTRGWPASTCCPSFTKTSSTTAACTALIGFTVPVGSRSPWATTTSSILVNRANRKAKLAVPIRAHTRVRLQVGAGRSLTSCRSLEPRRTSLLIPGQPPADGTRWRNGRLWPLDPHGCPVPPGRPHALPGLGRHGARCLAGG